MKISLHWLGKYLSGPVAPDQLEPLLMGVGFPVDGRQPAAGGDEVFEVEVTSNRPDCLSHLGVAREVAAATGLGLVPPVCDLPAEGSEAVEATTSVALEAPQVCPVYTARVIRGVKVGPSPAWLVQALEAIGLRSVNNVVDVTNYVLFEMGQPLHAFDLGKLAGRRIVVREAREGEPFVAIDSTKHALKPGMLVIADAQAPQAVAGVMGGLASEVGPATTDILLESAIFAPLSIRRTSRALKLKSDSSYRFERGIDPCGVEQASRRAARLIVELAGGTIARGVIRAGEREPDLATITLRPERCRAILGTEVATAEMVPLLDRLGLAPRLNAAGDLITCTAPSHRLDLKKEIDLIEEVGRLAGYDRLPVGRRIAVVARAMQGDIAAGRRLRQVLSGHGYYETVTFSFVQPRQGEPFLNAGATAVRIDDERRKKEPMLRPSVLPSLLVCRKANQDVGNAGVRLFETAATWQRQGGAIVEKRRLGLVADVEEAQAKDPSPALRELRGVVAELIGQLRAGAVTFVPVQVPYLVGAAEVRLDGQMLGVCGGLTADTAKLFELSGMVAVAELEYDPLVAAYPPQRQTHALPRFPAIERDLSVVVEEAVPWARLEAAVRSAGPQLLEETRFVTTYRGKPIPKGKKSVTLRLVFRDPQATLRHEQVDPQVAAVVGALQEATGAELRQ